MDNSIEGIPAGVIEKNRKSIKRNLDPKGFFQYLSSEYMRIREFSRKNGVISFSFMVFMRLDSQLPERFIQQIQRSLAEPLHKALAPIVDNGWRVFDKYAYNQLVYTYTFAKKIAGLKPQVFSESPAKILDNLKDLELAFMVLASSQNIIASLEKQLSLYAKLVNQPRLPVDSIIRAIQMLLTRTNNRLTLYSLFVSLNSIHLHRFCDLPSMLDAQNKVLFSSDFFEVDDHNRQLLSNYTIEVVTSIEKQLRNHNDIMLFKDLIPVNVAARSHDTSILKKFYNHATGEEDRFSSDFDNLPQFLMGFSQKAIIEFNKLLSDTFTIQGQKTVRVFDQTVFSNFLNRLNYLKEKIDKIILKVPRFERRRYLLILSEGNLNVNATEEPVMAVISEMLGLYFQMGKMLATILSNASKAKDDAHVPVIRPINFAEIQFFIPHESTKQFSSAYLAGMTVGAALENIASLLLTLCLELREPELITILNKDIHTMDTLKKLIGELKRVATPSQYNAYGDELGLSIIEQELNI